MNSTTFKLGRLPASRNRRERKPNGFYNDFIREAIARGMKLSPDGRIIFPSGKIEAVNKAPNVDGYNRVTLYLIGNRKASINRARIVCWLTHGEPPESHAMCDHIDRNRANDSPENLRWVTHAENNRNVKPGTHEKRSEILRRRWHEVRRLRAYHSELVAALRRCADAFTSNDDGEIFEAEKQARHLLERIDKGAANG